MTLTSGPRTADRLTGAGGRRRTWGSSLVTVLLLAAVIVFGLLALPRVFGYGTLVVRSGSMEQTAPVGSLVVARPLAAAEVRVGDVILVRREGTTSPPVLHRVVTLTHRKGEVVVTTKGDSNKSADPTPYLLRGTTMTPILALPHVGRALDLARTPLGWTMLIAFPASVLLWLQLRTIWFRPRQNARPPVPTDHAQTAG